VHPHQVHPTQTLSTFVIYTLPSWMNESSYNPSSLKGGVMRDPIGLLVGVLLIVLLVVLVLNLA
jgi:hypothetical protein